MKDALLQDYHAKHSAFKGLLQQTIPVQSTQLVYQKSMVGSTSYRVEDVEFSQEDIKKTETFLVDHLSQVIKK